MRTQEQLKEKREEILRIAARHGARNVRVFGSVARGEADEASDIDFLVEMEPGRSIFDMGGLLMDLQELLGCKVDLATDKGLKPRIRDRVLREAVNLRGIHANACGTFSRPSPTSNDTHHAAGTPSRRMNFSRVGLSAISRLLAKLPAHAAGITGS